MRKNVCVKLLSLLLLTVSAAYGGASAGDGFYSGFISQSSSREGANRIAAVTFTINNGELRGSLGHTGIVASDGNIEFRDGPAAYPFTTGLVTTGGIVRASTIVTDATGANSTLLLEAHATDPTFSEDKTLYGRLTLLQPQRGIKDMNRVRYVDGEFIAVGPGGTFANSDNGLDWFRAGLPTSSDLYDVAKSADTYVAVGQFGHILTSTNLLAWNKTVVGTNDIASVSFGNNVWVAADQRGYIYTSIDGFSWTARPAPIPKQTNAAARPPFLNLHPPAKVEFLNGEFLLWATNAVSFSANGQEWTAPLSPGVTLDTRASPSPPMAFGNGRYILVSRTRTAISTNRTDWHVVTNRSGGFALSHQVVVFGQDKFWVCAGTDFYSSEDGLVWQLAKRTAFHGTRSVAYGEGLFVAVGDNSSTSMNGTNWVRSPIDSFAPPPSLPILVRTGTNPITTFGQGPREGFYAANPAEGPLKEANVNAFSQIGDIHLWVGDAGYIYYYQTNNYAVLSPIPRMISSPQRPTQPAAWAL